MGKFYNKLIINRENYQMTIPKCNKKITWNNNIKIELI